MTALKDLGPSIIRTVVPWLVGLLVAFLADHKLPIDEGTATAIVTTIVSTVYYAAVRLAETRLSPLWGWLLGSAKAPTYEARHAGQ